MKIIQVDLGPRSYPIYIEPGLLDQLGALYRKHGLSPRVAIITDETVAKLCLARVQSSLSQVNIAAEPIVIPPGENYKSLAVADGIFEQLIEKGFTRDSTVVALGGGVVGDVAGFVAATLLRGVSLVQLPTTLLAQVDSSVGGKVGVNHRLGKNLIGTFYQPRFVLIDPELLKALPLQERRSGLAEVIKYGLIGDERLFTLLEDQLEELLAVPPGSQALLEDVIARCCMLKSSIVAQDEIERDARRLLNFGHTIGHALEAALDYQVRHGEAVAWGMQAAAWLSWAKGLLCGSEFARIRRLLTRLKCPSLEVLDEDVVLRKVYLDKKTRQNKIHFVLLRRLGEAVVRSDVSEAEIRRALAHIKDHKASV